ncbi:MAG TPA: 1-acyl-sn-glycerol-3-phosphate acyltransferase, partial [Thermoleophilaceae bacterium]|nr:1-acyl-sn-glycerol-3-phosphate acyltransferase [Thermoleophilaceae bacterium]
MRDLHRYHARAREHGVNRLVYWPVRAILQPAMRLWFRLERQGREHVPRTGPVILAANHRSFLDPFIVGVCLRRPVYFVAKQELFARRWQGWLLNALGAFPIRRGESDEESMATARAILARGDAVVIFPEGTRIRRGSLGRPKRGVGRLALETGAPVVPIAVAGTERVRRGWVIRPAKVRARCGRPLTFPRVEHASPSLAARVTERIWPCVELQWEWLGGLPPLRTAAVVGAGSMGTAAAIVLSRAGVDVQLGCRTAAQAETLSSARENTRYLPGLELDRAIDVKTVPQIEFAGVDLVVLAVPCAALPAAVGEIGARTGERSAVLVASKGL